MNIKQNIIKLINYLLILLILLTLIIKIIYYLNIYYFKNTHYEDKFHLKNERLKGKCRHKIEKVFTNLSDNDFLSLSNFLEKNLINFFRNLLGNNIDKISDNNLLLIIDDNNLNIINKFNDNKVDVILTIIDIPNKKIITIFDHAVVSGFHFIKYSEFILSCEFMDLHNTTLIPLNTEYNILKGLFFRPDKSNYNSLELFNSNSLLKKINLNYVFDKLKFDNNNKIENEISIRTCIMYDLLLIFSNNLKLNRNIRVLIPITFKPSGNINNNVSGFIIDINMYPDGKKITINEFDSYVKSQYYQIIAGEYITKLTSLINLGGKKELRYTIDIIISIGVFSNPKILPSNILFSYNTIGDNPLYCNLAIFNNDNNKEKNIVFGNLMINSNKINTDLLIKQFRNNGIISKYF